MDVGRTGVLLLLCKLFVCFCAITQNKKVAFGLDNHCRKSKDYGMNRFSFLTAEAKKLREAAQKLEEAAEILKEFGSDSVSEPTSEERTDELEIDKPRTGMALIVEIMQIYGKPISKQEIFDKAQSKGAKMKSIATLSSYLSRDESVCPVRWREMGISRMGISRMGKGK